MAGRRLAASADGGRPRHGHGHDAGRSLAKDHHSLWLNTSALERAGGDLDVPGGVVERDGDGSPTGVLREESAWRFRERFVEVTDDEWDDAVRDGIRVANARGVGAIHDKDGAIGAASIFGRIHEREGLSLRVWQSLPADRIPELATLGLRSRVGDDFLRLGYLKAFMDGTLGSRTASMLDGSGVQITTREELEDIVLERGRTPAGRSRFTRSVIARTAMPWTPSRRPARRGGPSDFATGSSTPSASTPWTFLGSPRSASPARSSSRTHPPTATWQSGSGRTASRAPMLSGACWTPGAVVANGSDAPVEELDPLAGIRAGVLRTIDDRPGWRSTRH